MKKTVISHCALALMICVIISNQIYAAKTKLYAIYTPSHKVLVDDWFLPSIQDDFEIILVEHDQESATGNFMSNGWMRTMCRKVELWIEAVQDNWNKIFICSDVDIQFFEPVMPYILSTMEDNDILIQKNQPNGQPCTGFFACRGNEKTLNLFRETLKILQRPNHGFDGDQGAMNSLIEGKNSLGIKWKLLPIEFYAGGTLTGKSWNPGNKLPVPKNILLHHANWTIGVGNKIKQLQYVKNIVSIREQEINDQTA